ncbi:hypothetical protein QE152_g15682 [Popillia japonica]|uniref:Uncharacterized protein n=1 Tax=Popillia japonica TaxID=7064 RepID=A0AAW1L7A7_POPJA
MKAARTRSINYTTAEKENDQEPPQTSSHTSRRRPTAVKTFTSSALGEMYEQLVQKKLEYAECLKREPEPRLHPTPSNLSFQSRSRKLHDISSRLFGVRRSPILSAFSSTVICHHQLVIADYDSAIFSPADQQTLPATFPCTTAISNLNALFRYVYIAACHSSSSPKKKTNDVVMNEIGSRLFILRIHRSVPFVFVSEKEDERRRNERNRVSFVYLRRASALEKPKGICVYRRLAEASGEFAFL